MDALFTKHRLPTKWIGDTPLFDTPDSIRLIDLCTRMEIGVLGIEGFTEDADGIKPDMTQIFDGSDLFKLDASEFAKQSVKGAWRFIEEARDKNLLFEFELVRTGLV